MEAIKESDLVEVGLREVRLEIANAAAALVKANACDWPRVLGAGGGVMGVHKNERRAESLPVRFPVRPGGRSQGSERQ